jgi:hypothetical protein
MISLAYLLYNLKRFEGWLVPKNRRFQAGIGYAIDIPRVSVTRENTFRISRQTSQVLTAMTAVLSKTSALKLCAKSGP